MENFRDDQSGLPPADEPEDFSDIELGESAYRVCGECGRPDSEGLCIECREGMREAEAERHAIDTETLRCSCDAPMCLSCGGCSKVCLCTNRL